MAKFYAVKSGHNPGIYNNYVEAIQQLKGYKNNKMRSFDSIHMARDYLHNNNTPGSQFLLKGKDVVNIYIDGSYNRYKEMFSYGMVVYRHKTSQEFYAGKSCAKNSVHLNNVAGELLGAKKALEYCVSNKIKKLNLYFDYDGIQKICTGEYTVTSTGIAKDYKEMYIRVHNKMQINFVQIKSHSGNKFHDRADKLAKWALDDI